MQLVDPLVEEYCVHISSKPSSLCEELADFTRQNVPHSQMLIGPLEASVLGFLIRACSYRRVLEIGTYTGYSALAMAENLPDEGELISLDINAETTEIAKRFWARSPHGKKIHHILGDARESIEQLKGNFDLVFIDADKESYGFYFEKLYPRLSPRASVVVDNTLWSGRVLQANAEGSTKAIQDFNQMIASRAGDEFYVSLLPVRDGMLLIQKR